MLRCWNIGKDAQADATYVCTRHLTIPLYLCSSNPSSITLLVLDPGDQSEFKGTVRAAYHTTRIPYVAPASLTSPLGLFSLLQFHPLAGRRRLVSLCGLIPNSIRPTCCKKALSVGVHGVFQREQTYDPQCLLLLLWSQSIGFLF